MVIPTAGAPTCINDYNKLCQLSSGKLVQICFCQQQKNPNGTYFRSWGLSKFATEEEAETLPVNTNIVFQLLQFSFDFEPTLNYVADEREVWPGLDTFHQS